jgi:hypothetical protein
MFRDPTSQNRVIGDAAPILRDLVKTSDCGEPLPLSLPLCGPK